MDTLTSCPRPATCNFDKTPTIPILMFELTIFLGAIIAYMVLSKIKKNVLLHWLIVAIGVAIFELFTAPMWRNYKLGQWAYIYKDISWILNIGWTILILPTVLLVDKFLSQLKQWQRFFIYLLILTPVVFLAEATVVALRIRSYAPEVIQMISGIKLLNVPIEAFYYIPVFMTLVICFYKYWSYQAENKAVVPVKNTRWLRSLILTFIGVFLFELLIDPLVTNANLPRWSYVYHDISILMSGMWIIIIWLSTKLVDKFFINLDLAKRFILYVLIGSAIELPIESFLVTYGYRVYGPSAMANYSGFYVPVLNIPIEVAFAVPFYLALIIAFLRYWEIVFDNKL